MHYDQKQIISYIELVALKHVLYTIITRDSERRVNWWSSLLIQLSCRRILKKLLLQAIGIGNCRIYIFFFYRSKASSFWSLIIPGQIMLN